jgi:subtilisin family serine protease
MRDGKSTRRVLATVVLILCVTSVPAARAAHGDDPVSRKVSRSLLEPPLLSRATTTVQASEPWRQGSRVHVYVRVTSTHPATVDELRRRGLEIAVVSDAFGGLVDGWADAAALPRIAELPAVTMIRPVASPHTQAGAVVTLGDAGLRADIVRAAGFTGAGVPLGLISDGITSAAQFTAAGELPAVTVPPDPRCSNFEGDEGTAMLEIVHDVAPGAGPLFFASFGQSGAGMAEAVRCLADAGSRVIVDDVTFPDEPFFQDGPLAIAAREVVQRGVSYHTSAGNRRQEFFQQALSPATYGPPLGVIHNFDPEGQGDPANEVTLGASRGATCVIQWDEPFGQAATDLDLVAVQGSPNNVIAKSDNPQDGTQDPVELISLNNPTDTEQTVSLVVQLFSGDPSRLFRMMCFRSVAMERTSPTGAIYGQQNVNEVVVLGAIDVADEGHDTIESASSPGPGIIVFPAFELREKPDVASFDGVETAVGQAGLFPNPFFGTSAAAPHSGAVAALMLSKNPTLSPAQIQEIMKATAVDIEAPGFDDLAGAGRLDALAAVAAVPCFDANTLAATASCSGEKVPKSASSAYRAARKRLLALGDAPSQKARKALAKARTRLQKTLGAVSRSAAKGKISGGCAANVNGLFALMSSTISCRISG